MVIEQQSLFEQSVYLLICHMCHSAEATEGRPVFAGQP